MEIRYLDRGRRHRRARLRQQGMTLVEIMIVVIIMALIATAVGIAVVPKMQQARVTQTRTDAQSVASAVASYMLMNVSADCPTVEQLVEAHELSGSSRTKDAWDNDFQVNCDGAEPVVTSPGPDGQMGTEDDISTGS
jgi:general secretion pathway protein G